MAFQLALNQCIQSAGLEDCVDANHLGLNLHVAVNTSGWKIYMSGKCYILSNVAGVDAHSGGLLIELQVPPTVKLLTWESG